MSLDLEAEYNNRARVPSHPAIIARWAAESKAYRNLNAPRVIEYGPGERNTFDMFDAGDGPTVMFVHGGYWQALDKSFFSNMARSSCSASSPMCGIAARTRSMVWSMTMLFWMTVTWPACR